VLVNKEADRTLLLSLPDNAFKNATTVKIQDQYRFFDKMKPKIA